VRKNAIIQKNPENIKTIQKIKKNTRKSRKKFENPEKSKKFKENPEKFWKNFSCLRKNFGRIDLKNNNFFGFFKTLRHRLCCNFLLTLCRCIKCLNI
jgi:hypothetical protein